jgi:hypothetical protein
MTKGQNGNWEVTTKPPLPGFHYYAIFVDGFASNDPGSRVCFAARKEVSGLEVPGPDENFFAVNNVPHGTVRTERYFSKATNETRRIFVYTPLDTTRARIVTQFFTCSMGGEKTKADGVTRDTRTSFSTI